MAELQIRKKSNKNFYHVSGSYNLSFSDLRIRLDETNQRVTLTRENGAFIIDRNGFAITDISVYDDSTGGNEETFGTVQQLSTRLIALGYPAYYRDGEIVLGNIISTDADNSLILGSDGLLYTPPAGTATNGLPAGGTTGQVLKKQSATNFDADWEDAGYIPLSGTEVGSPVTGDIELDDAIRLYVPQGNGGFYIGNLEDDVAYITSGDVLSIGVNNFNTSKGLQGQTYFGANYDDNTYVQKKYVDELTKYHEFACSDELSDLTTGTVYEQRLLRAFNDCTSFDFGVITAPTGSTIIIDVQKNGTTVFDTKPTIDAGEFTTLTASTPQVITGGSVSFSAGDVIKVVIDQVGSTIAGINLKAQITYK